MAERERMGSQAVLVGRSAELARLRAATVPAQHGRLVVLEGDAGLGKSRLLSEWRPTVSVEVLEYAAAPYAAARDVLAALDARAPRVLKGHAAIAGALRPVLDLAPVPAGRDPGEQRRLLDAVVEALALFAKAEPLSIAIEDVHWIDSASAAVIVHAARRLSNVPLCLTIAYRASEAAQAEPSRALLAQLSRLPHERITLQPLSADESMLLLQGAATRTLPLQIRRSICELSQGNPLLLIELARHACENPGGAETSLPVSIQALVHERLSRFAGSQREALRVCAAMEVFEAPAVAEIAGISADELTATLRTARELGIVGETAHGFVFRHALIRRAINDDLLGVERAAMHARIARMLERSPGTPGIRERLAYHYWMAAEGEACERYNAEAARSALALFAFDAAAQHFERALYGRPIAAETIALYRSLADAYERAGRHRTVAAMRRNMFGFARSALPGSEAAAMGIELSRSCFHALDDDGSIAAVLAALEAAGPDAPAALRFELHGLLAWYLGHLRRTEESREALEAASALLGAGEGVALIRYHEARAAYEVHARGGGSWKEEVERAIAVAREVDDYVLLHRYTNGMALAIASELDDYAYAFDLSARARSIVEAIPAFNRASYMHVAARVLLVAGRLEEAQEALESILPLAEDAPAHAFRAASVGIPLALRTGNAMLLQRCTRPRLLEEAFASKDPIVFGPVAAAVAGHMLEQGLDGEARALVERSLARITDAGNNLDLILCATRTGSPAASARARELLAPWAERSRSARAVAHLIDAGGAQGQQRRRHALAAADIFASLPWPLHQAQALELAGDLDAARAIYEECGALADLRRIGEAPGQNRSAPVLSKREGEVARLVAEGKSNRAIAESLVLSERTVESHIASIFAKLGMRSRAEVASFVARENVRAV